MAKKGSTRSPKNKKKFSRHMNLSVGNIVHAPPGQGRHATSKPGGARR